MIVIGNATILEMIWFATGVIGFSVNVWALNDSLADLRWQQAVPHREGPDRRQRSNDVEWRNRMVRERIAWGSARDETLRSLIQLLFILIAVVAMATPPANPLSAIITIGLLTTQGLLAAKAVLNRRDRLWIIGTLTRREWKED